MGASNILKSILDGGPTMIPYIVFVILLIACFALEVAKKPVLPRVATFYFLFPIAFVILAVLRVVLAFHSHYTTMTQVGSLPAMQYAEAGLAFTRSALVLISTAIITFLTAFGFLIVRNRKLG